MLGWCFPLWKVGEGLGRRLFFIMFSGWRRWTAVCSLSPLWARSRGEANQHRGHVAGRVTNSAPPCPPRSISAVISIAQICINGDPNFCREAISIPCFGGGGWRLKCNVTRWKRHRPLAHRPKVGHSQPLLPLWVVESQFSHPHNGFHDAYLVESWWRLRGLLAWYLPGT